MPSDSQRSLVGHSTDPIDHIAARQPRVFDSSEGRLTRLTAAELATIKAALHAAAQVQKDGADV